MFFFRKKELITKYKIINSTELIIGATQAAVLAAAEQAAGKILIAGDMVTTINKMKTCLIEILPLHFSIKPHSAAV